MSFVVVVEQTSGRQTDLIRVDGPFHSYVHAEDHAQSVSRKGRYITKVKAMTTPSSIWLLSGDWINHMEEIRVQ